MEPNTLKVNAKIYSSNYASLIEAVKKLIRDPYGCFEQTSSTTYPLVMGLTFLKELPDADDEIKQMVLEMESKIKKGYDKLVTFETKDDGYEWFGKSPPHEALSAYGYMEFVDMAAVTSFVDSAMIQRLH